MTKHAEKHADTDKSHRPTEVAEKVAGLVPAGKELAQKPSMGRIVIFGHPGGDCPAIVTWVNTDDDVTLFVMAPDGSTSFHPHVKQGDGVGLWHWPLRV